VFEALFYLEELTCLSVILNQKCKIKVSENLKKYFVFSDFDLVQEIPQLSSVALSDFVCMFESDLKTLAGNEFAIDRGNDTVGISRLDKFYYHDLEIVLDKVNFFRAKYFHSDQQLLQKAYQNALKFNINATEKIISNKARQLIKPLPLVCLHSQDVLTKQIDFPFKECYFYSDHNCVSFFENNKVKAYSLHDSLDSYFPNQNTQLLTYFLADYFEDIYVEPDDLFHAALCKSKYIDDLDWNINLITDKIITENFKLKVFHESACHYFNRCDFKLARNKIMSFANIWTH
jgi:hypothetical protein